MANIQIEGNNLAVRFRYDQILVEALKAAVPQAARRYDGSRKLWLVDPAYGKAIQSLFEQHLGEKPVLPAATAVNAQPEIRVLELRYLGATKKRDDGSQTAFGWIADQWGGGFNATFPEAVLRAWFDGSTPSDTEQPILPSTFYGRLGIRKGASPDDIKTGYRRMVRQWHPDVCKEPQAHETFLAIQRAYEILSNPKQRARYDAGLALEKSLGNSYQVDLRPVNGYRSPLRCGWVLVEGIERLGRMHVSRIIDWQDIVDPKGRTLTTSWPAGADHFTEQWV